MGQPSEFSLESVRQLMLASGGRVTNHELVKCFRAWLTDPQGKEAARAQFKDYVNTLATIRQENGEKFLILKKKFYPEYYQGTSYIDTVTPTGYAAPGGGYDPSGYSNGLPSPDVPQYGEHGFQPSRGRRQPSSFYPEPPAPSQARGSPSMLDEVMAGFAPPSRTLGSRQLPALPSSPPYTVPPHSYPAPPSYNTQSSYPALPSSQPPFPTQPSYSALPSERSSYPAQPSAQPSYSALPSDRSSYASSYSSQPPSSHHSVGLPQGPHSLGLPSLPPASSRREPPYQRQASVDSISYREGYREPPSREEQQGYNTGFNPHMQHSLEPLQTPSYPEPALRSYQDSSLPGQRLSTASYSSSTPSQSAQSRGSIAAPPPAFSSPPGSSYSPSPRASIAPPYIPPSTASAARPPPPYRAPPPDPIQVRPLPPRPPDPGPSPHSHLSPPPPPKRTVAAESPSSAPPPLPRRPGPDPPPPRLGEGQRGAGREVGEGQSRLAESQQPSPTDSGFTEDLRNYPEPLNNSRHVSLSKSYGNLASEEDKENLPRLDNARSLDELQLDSLPDSASLEDAQSISVRERTKTFNRMASDTELGGLGGSTTYGGSTTSLSGKTKVPSAVTRRNSRAVDMFTRRGSTMRQGEDDSASITTIDPHIKQWMVSVAKGDYQTAAKMLMEEPKLARHRDFTCGYTALHWACKHNNLDMVKLLAGTYQASTSVRSHGGYTPLHIAAQSNHQEVFDLLVGAYRADANVRDYAGKKPRQYMMVQGAEGLSLSMSSDTFRTLKDRRKNRTSRMEKNPSMLRFGSLSVKVKKTTEAFNNYFGSSSSSDQPKPKWEREGDTAKMPPPKFAPVKKRNSKRTIDFGRTKSAPVTPTQRSPVKEAIPEACEGGDISDSDSEYGFGDRWGPGQASKA